MNDIDYNNIKKMINARSERDEESILKSYFSKLNLNENEKEEAIYNYKKKKEKEIKINNCVKLDGEVIYDEIKTINQTLDFENNINKNLNFRANILGTMYDILYETKEQNRKLKDCAGYCDYSDHTCHIKLVKENLHTIEDLKKHYEKVTRHELIHAFLFESGLAEECCWNCEEMVDWLAFQFPKIDSVMNTINKI